MKKRTVRFISAILAVITVISAIGCGSANFDAVYEYNGHKLKEDKLFYWMSSYKRNILASYSDAYDTKEFWNREYDGDRTVEEYFTEVITDRIKDYLISEALFSEYKLKLSADVKQGIKDDINEKIDIYGGRKLLNAELKNLKLDVSGLTDCYTMEEKHETVFDYLFGEGGQMAPDDGELLEYYNANYSRIKYIVFYTAKILTDENGNYLYDEDGRIKTEELTGDELKEKNAKIEECMYRISEGEDFEDLIGKYTEYDVSTYENGFYVSSNEINIWGNDIILALSRMKENETARVNEEEGVYIIKKLPLTDLYEISDADAEQLANLSSYAAREKYGNYFAELRKNITVYDDVLSKYKLSEIAASKYYSF